MKALMKRLLETTAGLRLLRVSELEHPQRQLPLKIRYFFDLYFSRVDPQNFFFLQVGAHDGRHHDPLYRYVTKYRLRGIAIEPQEDVFEQLQATYREYPNVTCVNAAVGAQAGTQSFYTIAGDTSLGTFNKSVAFSYGRPVKETKVSVVTFNDLVDRYTIKKIDLLQLDCEGYDFELLQQFDFDQFQPQIVNFESVLFSDTDREACEKLLDSLGYTYFRYERDTCAYKV